LIELEDQVCLKSDSFHHNKFNTEHWTTSLFRWQTEC